MGLVNNTSAILHKEIREQKAKIADYEKRERISKRVHKAKIAELEALVKRQDMAKIALVTKMMSCAAELEQAFKLLNSAFPNERSKGRLAIMKISKKLRGKKEE